MCCASKLPVSCATDNELHAESEVFLLTFYTQFDFRDRKTKKNDPASELMEVSHKLRAWIQDDTSAISNNQPAVSHQQTPDMLPKFCIISEKCTWLQLVNGIYFSWLLWYNSSITPFTFLTIYIL